MSRVVPQLQGVFAVWHQNDRFTATSFPRDYTHVATVRAASPQEAREMVRVVGDRNVTYEGGMSVPRRETLPGDVIVNSEGREFMVFEGSCQSMPGLNGRVEPPPHPPVGRADREMDR